MKNYRISYEVRKVAFVVAENEEEAITKGHEDNIEWEEDEITLPLWAELDN